MMDALAAIFHRLDPVLIGPVRWYGLSYLAAFAFGYFVLRALSRRGRTPLGTEQTADFICQAAIGTIVGGRLGYCIFYRPDLLVTFTSDLPFWSALAINQGGMASHGGMIGMVVAIVLFARRSGVLARHLLDLIAFAAPMGVFFGRLANFINGELYGRICSPDLAWAVKFPHELRDWVDPTHPAHGRLASPEFTQLFARFGAPGLQSSVESLIVTSRTNDEIALSLAPLLPTRHPSQLYAGLLEGLLLFLVLVWFWRKPRNPGLVCALCVTVYSIGRFCGEYFRMPDAHLGLRALELSRGQWLSLWMLAVGLTLFTFWTARPKPLMGGWRRQPKDPTVSAAKASKEKAD